MCSMLNTSKIFSLFGQCTKTPVYIMVMTYLNFLFSITSLDTGCFRFIYLFICNKNVLTTASQ